MNIQKIIEERLEKSEMLDRLLDKEVDLHIQKKCLNVLRLEQCVNWGKQVQKQNPEISRIIIDVQENEQAVGSKDMLKIIIAALDDANKPIRKRGVEAVAVVLFAGTIDKELIDFLDGADKKIYQLL
ncbi:MAG: hypothetical protein HFJ04_05395 [Lachnospiraceae bacterium]|nr:hypothetical protein [Lachnospiraceae bacterium]